MARELNMQFSGRIGPLVGCLRDGKYYYRSRPAGMRQSKATRQSSQVFGLASKKGKLLRQYLQHSIPNPKDIQMQRRLVGCISNWLRLDGSLPPKPSAAIPFLQHFNFNPAMPLEESWRVQPALLHTAPGSYLLKLPACIPARAIRAPADTTTVDLLVSAVSLRFDVDQYDGHHKFTIPVPFNNNNWPGEELALSLGSSSGNLVLVALQLRYQLAGTPAMVYAKPAKIPAALVAAVFV